MNKLITSIFIIIVTSSAFSQNIVNTLGTGGVFTIKDASNNYLTLTQSTGQVKILKTLKLENTTNSTTGIIFKGIESFIHNFGPANTFVGLSSGNFTMSGNGNSGFGLYSLGSNTTGSYNSSFGSYTLQQNTSGSLNSAFGVYSLSNNTTGNSNSAFGFSSLGNNTTGYYNLAFGYNSLYSNTTGVDNSAFGNGSLYNNTTAYCNSAFGNGSLYNNTTGNYNSAFGLLSLEGNNSGSENSAFGYGSLLAIETGNGNTAIGYYAGPNITSGSNNTAIGYNAQVPSGTSSNQVRIGNTDVTYAGIQVAWTITSDIRLKSNIFNSNLGLNFISKLNPVSYLRLNDESKKTEYGFIAQEVEAVLKENNIDKNGMITVTDEGMYELRYNDLLAPMVKAIQELKVESEKLSEGLRLEKVENENLKNENEEIKHRLLKLEQMQSILAVEIEKMKKNEVKEVNLGEK